MHWLMWTCEFWCNKQHRLWNVVQVKLKCRIHSSSVNSSFTFLSQNPLYVAFDTHAHFADELAASAFVFYPILPRQPPWIDWGSYQHAAGLTNQSEFLQPEETSGELRGYNCNAHKAQLCCVNLSETLLCKISKKNPATSVSLKGLTMTLWLSVLSHSSLGCWFLCDCVGPWLATGPGCHLGLTPECKIKRKRNQMDRLIRSIITLKSEHQTTSSFQYFNTWVAR